MNSSVNLKKSLKMGHKLSYKLSHRLLMTIGTLVFSMAVAAVQPARAASPAAAAPAAGSLDQFDYPELLVTPRASERLEMEAAKEPGRRFTLFLPIQAGAATNVVAAFAQHSNPDLGHDPNNVTWLAGLAVGGGWLAVTAALEFLYEPYRSASHEINALPRKTQREQLTRERLAEEAIDSTGQLGSTLKWLATATNLGAAGFMFANSKAGEFSRTASLVSGIVAFAPLIFPNPWEKIADEQANYKKRIYAPVASATLLQDRVTGAFVPGLSLGLRF